MHAPDAACGVDDGALAQASCVADGTVRLVVDVAVSHPVPELWAPPVRRRRAWVSVLRGGPVKAGAAERSSGARALTGASTGRGWMRDGERSSGRACRASCRHGRCLAGAGQVTRDGGRESGLLSVGGRRWRRPTGGPCGGRSNLQCAPRGSGRGAERRLASADFCRRSATPTAAAWRPRAAPTGFPSAPCGFTRGAARRWARAGFGVARRSWRATAG